MLIILTTLLSSNAVTSRKKYSISFSRISLIGLLHIIFVLYKNYYQWIFTRPPKLSFNYYVNESSPFATLFYLGEMGFKSYMPHFNINWITVIHAMELSADKEYIWDTPQVLSCYSEWKVNLFLLSLSYFIVSISLAISSLMENIGEGVQSQSSRTEYGQSYNQEPPQSGRFILDLAWIAVEGGFFIFPRIDPTDHRNIVKHIMGYKYAIEETREVNGIMRKGVIVWHMEDYAHIIDSKKLDLGSGVALRKVTKKYDLTSMGQPVLYTGSSVILRKYFYSGF